MAVNFDKPARWKADIAQSVDIYNEWFMNFAPEAFRATRIQTTKDVAAALCLTENMRRIEPSIIFEHPDILPTLRMSMCPPLAVDRLIGLSGVSSNLIKSLELKKRVPARMSSELLDSELGRIAAILAACRD